MNILILKDGNEIQKVSQDVAYSSEFSNLKVHEFLNNRTSLEYDAFLFLPNTFDIVGQCELDKFIETSQNEQNSVAGAYYANNNVYDGDKFLFTKCEQPYNIKHLNNKNVIYMPLLVKKEVMYAIRDLKHLYIWGLFLDLSKTTVLYHIPQVVFTTTSTFMFNDNLIEDIKKINDIYFS